MRDRIELLLKAKNITAKQFAEEIGVQPSGMSHILSGRNNPSIDFAVKLVNRYPEVNLQWLIMGTGEMYVTTPSTEPATSSPTNSQQQFVSMEPQPTQPQPTQVGQMSMSQPQPTHPQPTQVGQMSMSQPQPTHPQPTQVGQVPMSQPQPTHPQPTQVGQIPMSQPQPTHPQPTQVGQIPMSQPQPTQPQPTQVGQIPMSQQQVVPPQDATSVASQAPRVVTQPEIKVGESYDLFAGYNFDNLVEKPKMTTSAEFSQESTDVANVMGNTPANTLGNNAVNTLENNAANTLGNNDALGNNMGNTVANASEHMIMNANTMENRVENVAEYDTEQPTESAADDAMMSAHSETPERSRMDYQRNLREISAASIAREYRQRSNETIDNKSITDEKESTPEQVTVPQKYERQITKIIVVYDDHTFAEFLP